MLKKDIHKSHQQCTNDRYNINDYIITTQNTDQLCAKLNTYNNLLVTLYLDHNATNERQDTYNCNQLHIWMDKSIELPPKSAHYLI